MGAAPSGWLPPPYYPTPVTFASWCSIRLGAPAVNYNNQRGTLYKDAAVPGTPQEEVRFLLKLAAPLPIGTRIRGLVCRNSDFTLSTTPTTVPCAATGYYYLHTINADFNPAVETWNTANGIAKSLVKQGVAGFASTAAAVPGNFANFGISSFLSSLLNGFVTTAVCYGVQVSVKTEDFPNASQPQLTDTLFGFPAVDAAVANWQLHLVP